MQISQIVKKWRENYKEEIKEEKDAFVNIEKQSNHIYKHISLGYETEKKQWIKKLPEFIQHLDESPSKAKNTQDIASTKKQEEVRPKKQEEVRPKKQEEVRPKKQEEVRLKKQEEALVKPKKEAELIPVAPVKEKAPSEKLPNVPNVPNVKKSSPQEDEWEQARHEFTRGIFEDTEGFSSANNEKWQDTREKQVTQTIQNEDTEDDEIPEVFSNNYWDVEEPEDSPEFTEEEDSDFADDLLWDSQEEDDPSDFDSIEDELDEKESAPSNVVDIQNDSDFENLENLLKGMGKERPEIKDHPREFYPKKRKRNDNDRRNQKDKKQNNRHQNHDEKPFGDSKKKKYKWD